jgi:hypothetical protein
LIGLVTRIGWRYRAENVFEITFLTHIGIAMYNKEFHEIARIPFSFFEANSKQN